MIATAIDVILVLVPIEGIVLTILHQRSGAGPSPRGLWPNLAAGFLLMLGVRVALRAGEASAATQVALACILSAALVAHLADLAFRWRA